MLMFIFPPLAFIAIHQLSYARRHAIPGLVVQSALSAFAFTACMLIVLALVLIEPRSCGLRWLALGLAFGSLAFAFVQFVTWLVAVVHLMRHRKAGGRGAVANMMVAFVLGALSSLAVLALGFSLAWACP